MERSFRFIIGLAAVVLLPLFYYSFKLTDEVRAHPYRIGPKKYASVGDRRLEKYEDCVIPEIPLKPDALQGIRTRRIKPCQNTPNTNFSQLLDNGTLILLPSEEYHSDNCCVYEIIRPYDFPADTFQFKPANGCITFTNKNQIYLDFEFVLIECRNSKTNKSHVNYHAQVNPTSLYVNSKLKYWKRQSMKQHKKNVNDKDVLPVNVMVLVLDSTSRNDAFRSLPKTMNFLLNKLKFTDFRKFHCLGEPTLPNAIPLLTGIPRRNFSQNHTWSQPWDDVPFIWKNFSMAKYVTAFMEDIPDIANFNYGGQTGFRHPPTSLYLRPFISAFATKIPLRSNMDSVCLGPKPIFKVILDYQLEILRKLNNKAPTFSVPWLCWPFHDFFATLSTIENDMLDFFKQIGRSKGILENTVLIVMGDHGFRSSPYSKSHEGYLERRLPLFLIRLPKKLQKLYPNFESIVKQRSEEVTSHYDVYKTLLHLSQLGLTKDDPRVVNSKLSQGPGISLFVPLTEKGRKCSDAGIPDTYCACGLPSPRPREQSGNQIKSGPIPDEVRIKN